MREKFESGINNSGVWLCLFIFGFFGNLGVKEMLFRGGFHFLLPARREYIDMVPAASYEFYKL